MREILTFPAKYIKWEKGEEKHLISLKIIYELGDVTYAFTQKQDIQNNRKQGITTFHTVTGKAKNGRKDNK